ncbi:hypothetical protein F0562_004557 [Nyssa sinensis]|uniref:TPX2 C-terminal domain-containing protein n=1 Tax=Nyssa sinensis TaxID=561372 RepID=A0A5J5C2P5_9ASTE|nr:hypothetical protein F0562_004557 [Nyssa sinensis]
MGESACLIHPFADAPGMSNEAKQGNPMHALEESISFGRFMSESLDWDKWSTFSQNRFVEEAKRYAQPGSVAQKKAFFEAHYKRIAAKKAAALHEQANATNNTTEPEIEGRVCDITDPRDSQPTNVNSQVAVNEQNEIKATYIESSCIANGNGHNSDVKHGELQIGGTEHLTESSSKDKSLNQLEFVDKMTSGLKLSGTSQMEKPLLEQSFNSSEDVSFPMSKKKPGLSSLKSSVNRKASIIPSSPTKPTAPVHPKKENNVTPITRKSTIEPTDKRKSTPKSLYQLINFTPARETDKFSTPDIQKIESSKVAPSSSKAFKDCTTPLRTPTMAPKHPPATPSSENRRARTPLDLPATGSKTTRPTWHILSAICSKTLSACRNKLQSPTLSTPFKLRTEERAARRKQKLEEKFNAKEAQKVQLQTKLKEKAETEHKKMRQSLCFKARPLPDFYRERETPKNQTKKTPLTHPQSPRLGRKPNSSTMQGTTSLPPLTPLTKNSGPKHVLKKNSQTPPACSLTSQPEMIIHENTSPNIQH